MDKNHKKALLQISDLKSSYKKMLSKRHRKLKKIYKEVMSYAGKKEADWDSALKINFANQIESLVTARITSKNPRYIVSFRQSPNNIAKRYFDGDPEENQEAYKEFENDVYSWAASIQEYLNFAFEEYHFNKQFRLMAKSLVRYGNAYGEAGFKTEKLYKKRSGKVEEMGLKMHPYIENVSFSELFYDPRYHNVEESPGVIRTVERVRLGELKQIDGLINLDKIKNVGGSSNQDKREIYSLMLEDEAGNTYEQQSGNLVLDKFQGYFKPEDEEEGLYEIWTINDSIVVKFDPIPEISVKGAACFEDPEQALGIGYIEPMLDAQNEYNFKLNSVNQSINQALNRSWFWDPNSGIDPRALSKASAPGAIIPVTNGMQAAQTGLQEILYRPIPGEYFANQNEIRRDMQSLSFTVDTTAPSSQQGFTNTATAVRARFFESNVMYADTLKHLEELLTKLAYDLLDKIAENASDDIIIGRLGKGRFKWAKPAIFDDAPLRYAINVEVGSSSFDSVENRREEALAMWTLAKDAAASGTNVDLEKVFEEVLHTFEKRDVKGYVKKDMNDLLALLGGGMQEQGQPSPTTKQEAEIIQTAKPGLDNPEELTKSVAGGNV